MPVRPRMPLPASPGMRAGLLRPAALRGGLCGAGRHRQALHRRSFGLGHSLGYPFSLSSGPITTARYTVLEDEYELGEELGAGRCSLASCRCLALSRCVLHPSTMLHQLVYAVPRGGEGGG